MIYRYPQEVMLAGVCTGLAKFLGLEVWVVRVVVVLISIFGGLFAMIIAYVAGVLLMEKAPLGFYDSSNHKFGQQTFSDFKYEGKQEYQNKNNQQYGKQGSSQQTIDQLRDDIEKMDARIKKLETYLYTKRK